MISGCVVYIIKVGTHDSNSRRSNCGMANELENAVEVLRGEIVKSRRDIKSAIEASETKLLLKIEELNHKVKELEQENTILVDRIETLEVRSKKNNIIIFGLESSESLCPVSLCRELHGLLDVEIQVSELNNIYKIKAKENPIKVEFISYLKKLEVMNNCKKLKGTEVFISSDLTYKQRCCNRILRGHLRQAREETDARSYIKGNKLYVNNRAYTVEELEGGQTRQSKVNSAPSTPTPHGVENVFELPIERGKRAKEVVREKNYSEKQTTKKKESANSATPSNPGPSKGLTKAGSTRSQPNRVLGLRSGSSSSVKN